MCLGAPKSRLPRLQTEVSETFHCGPLGRSCCVSGLIILYLKTGAHWSISSSDTTKRIDHTVADI